LTDRYEVEREIGRGGMATVFLARDLRHDRLVALKVLDPEIGAVLGVERFLAEIRVTAKLQHPNLLPLFDSGTADGLLFYVMPFVEGESLRVRLQRERQLPVDEAIRIASTIAGALAYAHRHGVVHRDLKPENVLLHDSQPLVADFGIALAVHNAAGTRITQTGVSLGTPQYMSPEQATGDRVIDARSDLYSLGVILYEMLTGEPPHTGPTSQAILARVVTETPRRVREARPNVPPHVEACVARALEKLPADRFASASEFSEALVGKAAFREPDPGTRRREGHQTWRRHLITVATHGAAATAAVWFAWMLAGSRAPLPSTARFPLNLQSGERISSGIGNTLAVSPDGRFVAYSATREASIAKLYVRRIDDLQAREVPGTEGGYQPVFSPDGEWIAFVAGEFVKKVRVSGGAPVDLAPINIQTARGLSWGANDEIVVGMLDGSLVVVPSAGGPPRPLLSKPPPRGQDDRWPLVLPDGKTVVFARYAASRSELWVASLSGREPVPLDVRGSSPLGVVDGRLIYLGASGVLMAVPFRGSRVTGTPVPVIDHVAADEFTGNAHAAVSSSGTLVYRTGASRSQLGIADDRGWRPVVEEPQAYAYPRFSPDGMRIAVRVDNGPRNDILIVDRDAGTHSRLTPRDSSSYDRPEWNADGTRVIFVSESTTRPATLPTSVRLTAVWSQPWNGSAPASPLLSIDSLAIGEAVLAEDGTLLFRVSNANLIQDIWYRRSVGDTTPTPYVTSAAFETGPRFSPDRRWIAYASDISGTRQVYVKPFPGPGNPVRVSPDGGEQPIWRGGRLFYVRQQELWSVDIRLTPTLSLGARRKVLEGPYDFEYRHASYDVSSDGERFLLLRQAGDARIVVVLNWAAELRSASASSRN
jgi:serine/threonine-protein kinase